MRALMDPEVVSLIRLFEQTVVLQRPPRAGGVDGQDARTLAALMTMHRALGEKTLAQLEAEAALRCRLKSHGR